MMLISHYQPGIQGCPVQPSNTNVIMSLEVAYAKRDYGNCVNKSSEVQKILEEVFVAYKNCMSQAKIQWEFLFS